MVAGGDGSTRGRFIANWLGDDTGARIQRHVSIGDIGDNDIG